ncbi:uncharacterized protein LOC129589860 [Paramacrobiotus metropolitanus]|uniref:uncharacterized protein LOC129589860 n=1 Tax=Paramacrobiotus metropolitanus TaxID=2943436 RepID=UPI00244572C7|nr:uncharacterized protein LOC129589860 [Paramacrobiotus metropolitanus]
MSKMFSFLCVIACFVNLAASQHTDFEPEIQGYSFNRPGPPGPSQFPAPLPRDYESLDCVVKQDILWRNIAAKPYPTNAMPTINFQVPVTNQLLNQSFIIQAFTLTGDEFPVDRPKLIHTYGSTGKVTLEIFRNSSYSGMFAAGSMNPGIIRFSLGDITAASFGPSFALKLFVDHRPSVNIVAMNNPDGQGTDRNFFSKTFTNFRPAPMDANNIKFGKIFHDALLTKLSGGECQRPLDENRLPVYDVAAAYAGRRVNAPTVLKFIPNPAVGSDPSSQADFRLNLNRIRPESLLYTVAAKATENSREEIIGRIWLRSPLVSSEYQDKRLLFQHPRMRC